MRYRRCPGWGGGCVELAPPRRTFCGSCDRAREKALKHMAQAAMQQDQNQTRIRSDRERLVNHGED